MVAFELLFVLLFVVGFELLSFELFRKVAGCPEDARLIGTSVLRPYPGVILDRVVDIGEGGIRLPKNDGNVESCLGDCLAGIVEGS